MSCLLICDSPAIRGVGCALASHHPPLVIGAEIGWASAHRAAGINVGDRHAPPHRPGSRRRTAVGAVGNTRAGPGPNLWADDWAGGGRPARAALHPVRRVDDGGSALEPGHDLLCARLHGVGHAVRGRPGPRPASAGGGPGGGFAGRADLGVHPAGRADVPRRPTGARERRRGLGAPLVQEGPVRPDHRRADHPDGGVGRQALPDHPDQAVQSDAVRARRPQRVRHARAPGQHAG